MTLPSTHKVRPVVRQTVLPFQLERTKEPLTANGGLALLVEYTHALGLRALADWYLPHAEGTVHPCGGGLVSLSWRGRKTSLCRNETRA